MDKLTIEVTADLLSMNLGCDDEKEIWKLWDLKRQELREKTERYTKTIQYRNEEHVVRMLFDGRYAPEPTVGGRYAPEIKSAIKGFFGVLNNGNAMKAQLENLGPVLAPVFKELLLEYYKIRESQPERSLHPDPRDNFSDGREIMKRVEEDFDRRNVRKLMHEWKFMDNGEEFRFDTNV